MVTPWDMLAQHQLATKSDLQFRVPAATVTDHAPFALCDLSKVIPCNAARPTNLSVSVWEDRTRHSRATMTLDVLRKQTCLKPWTRSKNNDVRTAKTREARTAQVPKSTSEATSTTVPRQMPSAMRETSARPRWMRRASRIRDPPNTRQSALLARPMVSWRRPTASSRHWCSTLMNSDAIFQERS